MNTIARIVVLVALYSAIVCSRTSSAQTTSNSNGASEARRNLLINQGIVSGPSNGGEVTLPGWAPGAETEAEAYLRTGDLVKAEAALQRVFGRAPKGLDPAQFGVGAFEILGEIRLRQGKYAAARDYFLAAGQHHGSERRDLGLALAYCRLGDFRRALEGYRYLAISNAHAEFLDEKDQDRPGYSNLKQIEASLLLAKAHRFHGFLPDHGEAELRMAEGIIPTNAAVAFELGKVLLENKKFDEALTRFTTAATHGHGSLVHSASRQAATIAAWQRSQLATAKEADASKK